jgi:hypothetical protein
LSLRDVRKRLKGKSGRELITLLSKCYRSGNEVKRILSVELSEDEQERESTLEDLWAELRTAFWSEKRGVPQEPDLRKARKIVTEAGRLTKNPATTVGFMLEYVHLGARHSHEYGDMSEAFYSSLESMFRKATVFIVENRFCLNTKEILDKMEDILEECSHFGWGVQDTLLEMMTDMTDRLGLAMYPGNQKLRGEHEKGHPKRTI